MRQRRGRVRSLAARLALAALLAVSAILGSVSVSSARPTEEELEQAKAELVALNGRLSALVEQYDAAKLELSKLKRSLRDTRKDVASAMSDRAEAMAYLSERAAQAYMSAGSEIEVLLGSTTFADFSDRVQFIGDVARADVDAATRAEVASEQARRAQTTLEGLLEQQGDLLATLDQRTVDIEESIAEQQALIAELEAELAKPEVVRIVNQPAPPPAQGGKKDPSPEPPPPPPPPPPSSGADAAVAAAYSVIGVPYKWGGENPEEGFDCSGLTMWAWAHGGVSLPHSSRAQYDALPHVSRGDIKPGDLLFFYQPISHVALYVGNNQMIHATHPGSTVKLDTIESYWWAIYTGAGRPG